MRQGLIEASFTAWQIKDTGKTFPEYLKVFGLNEKEQPLTKEQKKQMIKRSHEVGDRIREADRKRKKKNEKAI